MFSISPRSRAPRSRARVMARRTTRWETSEGMVTTTAPVRPGQEIEESREPIGPRREIDQEQVERAPRGVGQELAEGRPLHRAAPRMSLGLGRRLPHDGRVVTGQEQVHRQDPDPLGGDGRLDAVGRDPERLAAHPQHLPHRRPVEVGVQHPHPEPAGRERAGEIRRDRALPDPALAGDHRDAGADRRHPRGEPPLLGDDLLDDVRAAVARDVAITLHVPVPSSLVSSGAAAGSLRCARKRRIRSSPRKSPGSPWRSVSK